MLTFRASDSVIYYDREKKSPTCKVGAEVELSNMIDSAVQNVNNANYAYTVAMKPFPLLLHLYPVHFSQSFL
jgi:hypothetical protein